MGSERRLNALYLLTVADIRGTSPKVWNAWKGKLLEDLFWSTRRFLSGDTDPARQPACRARQKLALQKLRLYAVPEGAHEKLWAQLDISLLSAPRCSRNRLAHPAAELPTGHPEADGEGAAKPGRGRRAGDDLHAGSKKPVRAGSAPSSSASASASWRPRYTPRCMAMRSILSRCMDPEQRHHTLPRRHRIHRARAVLNNWSATGRFLRRSRGASAGACVASPITPEVKLRPDERGNAYYLSFMAGDRPGLLSSVARVLVEYGIDVQTAKINTLGERAEDSFVVTGDALRETRNVINLESDLMHELET